MLKNSSLKSGERLYERMHLLKVNRIRRPVGFTYIRFDRIDL